MTRRSAGAVQQLDLLALQSAAVRRAWLALITQLPPPPPGIPRGQRSCATIYLHYRESYVRACSDSPMFTSEQQLSNAYERLRRL